MTNIFREPPIPAGATADIWDSDLPLDSDSARALNWSKHDTAKVGVGVDGIQYAGGPFGSSSRSTHARQ
jgi:hypothetical protein